MNKEKKEELKKVFSIIDPQKFLVFAKTYANKNEDFANAIIDHFMPKDNPIDYKTAIAECFNHKKKGRVSMYGLIYDWAAIRQDSKRVMKLLNLLIEAGDQHSAIDGALLFWKP